MDVSVKTIRPKILPVAGRRPSAVSQVLRAMGEELHGECGDRKTSGKAQAGFRIRVAADRETRERCYRLAHRMYRESGYVSASSNAAGLCVEPYDARPETFTLLAEDESGAEAGTISLAFDGEEGLPCDDLYAPELRPLRAEGRMMAEVTRLALRPNQAQSRILLAGLFSFTSIFALRVRRYTDFVIEVNPRHVNYYRRLLLFTELGPVRPCPRVNGAPAVLMGLNLSVIEQEMQRLGGSWARGARAAERTLYPYFHSGAEMAPLAEALASQHQSMSEEERQYFGLSEILERTERHGKRCDWDGSQAAESHMLPPLSQQ